MPHADLRVSAPDHCIAVWDGVLIQLWRKSTTLEAAKRVRAEAVRLSRDVTGELGSLIIVEANASLPDAETRAVLAQVPDDLGPRAAGVALAFERGGFAAAAVRAVLTGIMSLSRSHVPSSVFGDVDAASQWLARKMRSRADLARNLPEAVAGLRR